MTIKKTNAATLRKKGKTYTTIPNETIDSLTCAESLAILVYLASKPEKWQVRRNDLMMALQLGRDRYKRGTDELRSLGLWEVIEVRDALGKVIDRQIVIATEITPIAENSNWDAPIAENPNLRKPQLGEIGNLSNKGLITNKVFTRNGNLGDQPVDNSPRVPAHRSAEQILKERQEAFSAERDQEVAQEALREMRRKAGES